ncbi:MAG: fibronectin type III domain-containing protein, partial [Eubacterium sp.]
ITFKKVKGISGYEVQCATDKKFKKNKKSVTVKKNKTSATVKKLKVNKKYYVRVRTYKTVNGKKIYSSWSKVKSVKTK